ncbi:putative calmodulin-binding protein Sha1 [Aspergillus alliaceus]|uniref:putative calmodulin-binding protein Sha1 n=1 Tax=Petromyces alliaceus TaxID=209559 RepID=UPI0012A70705|nr:uncharacterized protein BDW43DRAFT_319625 [Aspergillus alliaceus]KAB8233678.1 hypothetical protein BDW43DRAFT_319625 [Aspergillus alliaceus]
MSGLLEEVGTPCPSRSSRLGRSSGDSSFSRLWEDSLETSDETVNVEFTTEIKAPLLTRVKPRRRTKTGSSFAIHDDGEPISMQTANPKRRETGAAVTTSNRKTSLLAQPAQRFRPKVSFANRPAKHQKMQGDSEKRLRNPNFDAEKNRELLMQINGNGRQIPQKDALKKDMRRNTVYIPPDDSTVASVFMRMFSPIKSNTMQGVVLEDTQINSLESQIARKRQAKRSLTSSAQRTPLQPSAKVKQESCIHIDIAGKNGGKENVPPGTVLLNKDKGYQPTKIQNRFDNAQKISNPPQTELLGHRSTKPMSPLATRSVNGPVRRKVMEEKRNNAIAPSVNLFQANNNLKKRKTKFVNKTLTVSKDTTHSHPLKKSEMRVKPSKSASLRANSESLEDEYPLVREHITGPALYEYDWLSHQEVMITQLINGLFDQTNKKSSFNDPTLLRHELLMLYQEKPFAHLYKRIQASLLYGAMSIPKDALAQHVRLRRDVGMKRKFLDFWMQTYNPWALRAAVETVTGRRILNGKFSRDSVHGPADTISGSEKTLKRELESFLNTFLLQNKDMEQHSRELSEGDFDVVGMAYHRTVLRSIMIIILLDKGRTSSGSMLPRCLFLRSSQLKSSTAVLQALARFLLPSSGDIIKMLGHLGCHLDYEQRPLEEYDYHISNLAVDMRDGVRLTKVVELLLYSTNLCPDNVPPHRESHTAELLGPLSRGLKLPCLSRAVKLFNVRIALDALACTESSQKLVRHVRAEDIVDGYREKTIALLWGLVSQWVIGGLVDWDDVRKEIDRLKHKALSQYGYESVRDEEWFSDRNLNGLYEKDDDPILLLKQWASILAYLKGLRLENLSTSFGDGKVYGSMMDEYEGYILDEDQDLSTTDRETIPLLQSRLRALGCSAQFAYLISSCTSTSHILDSDSTIGALAFLCSRLLSATKRARAAAVLQNTWRQILARRDLQRRTMARDVARQCAAVVQTRDRILWAKEIIVRWWRTTKAMQQRRNRLGSRYGRQIPMLKRTPLRGHQPPS